MMAISDYFLQIPPFLFFILIITFGGLIAGSGTFFFRKFVKMKILRSHNEVTGFLFLSIASFYAFLLSFVVFMVWGQLNETQNNVSKEGSSALGLYRDIKYYPDTIESKQLMIVYLDFVYNVIDEEFPNLGRMKPSRKTTESYNRVFYKIEHLNPKNQFQIKYNFKWNQPYLLDIEHQRMHVALNTLLGVFIGMLFFIIILLDHPYSGSLSIKPESYKQIFTMEQWDAEINLETTLQNK